MDKNPCSGKPEKKTSEGNFQQSLYTPEDQLFQRISLCQYLSDLSAFFENETTEGDPEEKKEQP